MSSNYLLFPKPHFNHLLFLFYFISSFIKQFLLKVVKEKDNLSIPFFKLYIYDLGDFLSIIPQVLRKKKEMKKKLIGLRTSSTNSFYIYNDRFNERYQTTKKRIKLNLFLITI